MLLFLYINRKKIIIQKIFYPFLYFVMYRTKLGLKLMDNMARKHPKFLKYLAYVGIVIGFLGMALISFSLVENIYKMITATTAVAGVALVLPLKVKGAFYVPFFYWIISIFLLAVVHEFSHGVISRLYKIKIKSSGLAFLNIIVPVIPAAFVEPDEEELRKRPHIQQLSVFAAGPFSNLIFAAVVYLIISSVMVPIGEATFDYNGVFIEEFIEGENVTFPAEMAGMVENELITYVDGTKINYTEDFINVMNKKGAGESIFIVTNRSEYNITLAEHPENNSMGYLGVQVDQKRDVKKGVAEKYGDFFPVAFLWIAELFYWLCLLNFGIGLFNLAPLGPIDGGRMLQLLMHKLFKKKKGDRIWKAISFIFLGLIIINLLFAFLI